MLNLTEELEAKLKIVEVSDKLSLDVLKSYVELIDYIEKDAMGIECEYVDYSLLGSGISAIAYSIDDFKLKDVVLKRFCSQEQALWATKKVYNEVKGKECENLFSKNFAELSCSVGYSSNAYLLQEKLSVVRKVMDNKKYNSENVLQFLRHMYEATKYLNMYDLHDGNIGFADDNSIKILDCGEFELSNNHKENLSRSIWRLSRESWFTFAIMNSGLGANCELLSLGMNDLTPELMLVFINDLEKINGGAK